MPLGSYEDWQRRQVPTPSAELADLVRRGTGSEPVRTDRILQGYSNEVYRVRCADAQDVVVRILRFDDDLSNATAAAEAAAIDRARAVGVPAPEILLLDTARVDGQVFPAMVQRTVPGEPLAAVIDRLPQQQRRDLLTEVGELIARLNRIPVGGVVELSTAPAAERNKIIAGGLSAVEADRILDLVESYLSDFPSPQGVLCHGDLSLKHIFGQVDTERVAVRVSGIIDFGDWQPGAPVHDLAVLRVREPQLEVRPILIGYGVADEPSFRRRLDLHTLMVALDALAFGVGEQDAAATVRIADQLRMLVDDLGS